MMPRYPDSPDVPWDLLARHLATEATADERRTLREWVRADPTHLQILTTVTRAWERADEEATRFMLFSPADVESAWQRFRPLMVVPLVLAAPLAPVRTAAAIPAAPTAAPLPWALRHRSARWQLAAGLLLLVGMSFAAIRLWLFRLPPAALVYASAGQRQRLRLPDGSTVWLNAHSRLRYAGAVPAPVRGVRAVQLTGEAYFDVAPNPARPFVVSTSMARVRVTGTAFNVRAYAAEDSVEVSVAHGRVWLTHLTLPDSVLLTAGTRAALRAADAPGRLAVRLHSHEAADPNFLAWQSDTLRFDDVPVAQVARTLRAVFGTAITLSSPALGQCRFTGTFAHPKPAQVLAVLATATASQLTANGQGGYQLQGAGCTLPTASFPAESIPRAPRP